METINIIGFLTLNVSISYFVFGSIQYNPKLIEYAKTYINK